MPIRISSLSKVTLDFTRRGPGLHAGISAAERALESDRVGYLLLDVVVRDGVLPVVMDRESLYILGFRCNGGWRHFSDVEWPFAEPAQSLGYDGQYATLGGLDGALTMGSVIGIGKLLSSANQQQWKTALRDLLVLVAENLRLIPVRMQVLGLLNGIFYSVALTPLERYIKNWGHASRGRDMSVQVSENHRVGFKDPTIIRR